ncbi:hypothetical protein QFZ32_002166 [Streptomyces canus]|nr:hypothetical protein [Streptomyces canus]
MPAAACFGFGGGWCSAWGSVGGSGPGWGVSVLGPAVAVAVVVLGDGRRPLRADTPHPVPCAPYAATGPSWRAARRTVRRGARGRDWSVVARGAGIGPSWRARWRTVRRGAGDCNSPGARGTARPAATRSHSPTTRPGTPVGVPLKPRARDPRGTARPAATRPHSPTTRPGTPVGVPLKPRARDPRGTARPAATRPHSPTTRPGTPVGVPLKPRRELRRGHITPWPPAEPTAVPAM